MKRITFLTVLLLLIPFFSSNVYGQLTGVKSIPGDYASIEAAFTALNTSGVGTGGVTFNVAAGHTETISDSLVLTATGTSANPIIFQKNGTGANPKITRTDAGSKATSTLGGQGDAVITIQGSDYVTFDGIDVAASDAGIEYGYYLRKASDVDGCKNINIKNATITMTKGTSQYVVGIYSSNNDASSLTSSATGITLTDIGGRNENITITGNTIQNVFAGIVLRGFNHTTLPYDLYDQNFVVGSSGVGNNIINYAGNAAATTYGVYLIYHNNANISYNYINNVDGGGSGATGILYGIFQSTGTLSSFTANNNNIDLTTSSTTSSVFGINNAATGNLTYSNNRIKINTTTTTSGTLGYLYNSSAAASTTVTISNNTFVGTSLLTSTSVLYLIYNNSSQATPGITNVSGNTIDGPLTRTATTGATYGYYNNGSPTGTENVYNNEFDSITTAGTGAIYGYLSTTGSSHTHNFYNNIASDLVTTGTGTVYGIHRTLASGSVYGNTVKNLTGGGTIWGISNGSGNVHIYKNNVYNLTSTSTGTTSGLVTGIYISAVTNIFVYNNFISDLKAPAATGTDAIRGIGCIATTTSSNLGIYYNTIFLNASSTGTNFGTSGIFHTYAAAATSVALDMRNNVIVNNSTPVGTGFTVAFRRSAATNLLNYSELSNNNSFYAGTPGPANLIFYDGTNADETLAAFKNRVTPRETNSVSENAPFVNSTTTPYDLHINPTVPTQLESGGKPITSPITVNVDFDGNTRNATFPDIGADEFNGIILDLSPPSISYTPLPNTSSTSARTLIVTVSDISGVPTTAPGWPYLYWKKLNAATWNGVAPSSVNGSNYTFTFGAGTAVDDTVQYYVVAQDMAATPNVTAFPTAGAGGYTINPPAASTPPTSPSFYFVTPPALSGNYTVGTGVFNRITGRNIYFEPVITKELREVKVENVNVQKSEVESTETLPYPNSTIQMMEVDVVNWVPMENGREYTGNLYVKKNENPSLNYPSGIEGVYATITAAVNDLNLRGVSGPTTFLLEDTLFSTETLPIIVNVSNEAKPTATNNVTIRPQTGVTTTVSGASPSSQVFRVISSYVSIDGSNSGGNDRNMTITNTSTTAPQVVGISSSGTTPTVGVKLKNTTIINGINTSTPVVVSAVGGTAGYFNNILIENNSVQRAYIGIYSIAVVESGNGQVTIRNNDLSTSGAFSVRYVGIYCQGLDGSDISYNTIGNFDGTSSEDDRGIWFATGTRNSVITGNSIFSLKYTGTSGYGAYGMAISTGTANANNTIFNNSIADISGDGWNYTSVLGDNPHGMYIFSTQSGIKVYYNSINLFGNTLNQTSALSTGIAVGTGSVVDIKNNNIVNNLGLLSATGYGSTGIYFQTDLAQINYSNYNNIYVNPTGSGLKPVTQVAATTYNTLSDWTTASTWDANSKSVDPLYTSTFNLRPLSGSQVLFAGNPIAGITTDILGLTRTNTPSIGAYEFPVGTIGWANLQWPGSGNIGFGGNLTVYGQIWADGITNQPGQAPGINAWLGYSTSNTNPNTWTNWIPATYNTDIGNNDEYMANIGSTLSSGTYYYAYRWQLYGGDYYYGGYNAGGGGQWDGTNNVSGVLTIQDPPLVTNWERSTGTSTLPSWFGTDTERGIAWGHVSSGPAEANVRRVFVASRSNSQINIRVLDDSTGADVGTLDMTGITGGTFAINDVEVDHWGHIYVCNLTTNASTSAFKVYRWDDLASVPQLVLNYTGSEAVRLGDKFTVAYNPAIQGYSIWAASASTGINKVYVWNQLSGLDSLNQVPVEINLAGVSGAISSAAVSPTESGSFYWNANGQDARKFAADGTLIGLIPTGVVGTGSNAIKFLGTQGTSEFVAVFQYATGNPSTNYANAKVLEIPNGAPANAVVYGTTNNLGTVNNTGLGDVAFRMNNSTVTVFVLGTNNGVGSYRVTQQIPVQLSSFIANVSGRDVQLIWTTATEINALSFEIEKNIDGVWRTIGSVKAAGNSTEIRDYSYSDKNLNSGKYSYRLRMVDFDGSYDYSKIVEAEVGIPMEFSLSQNYPNPFNPSTTVNFAVPFDSKVTVQIFAVTGELVETIYDGQIGVGYHQFVWNASRYASGMYIYRMTAQSLTNDQTFTSVKKMMLMK